MTESAVLYLGLGRLFIYLIQKAPYKDYLPKGFLTQLFECDLCLGWWVYLGLSLLTGEIWFKDLPYIPFVSHAITCSVATFAMWLIRQGWDDQFREVKFTE